MEITLLLIWVMGEATAMEVEERCVTGLIRSGVNRDQR